jgi:hypothetical protein
VLCWHALKPKLRGFLSRLLLTFSPCATGVLEIELLDAADLAAGDLTGQSDPYCILSVGDSAWTSGVRRFTRSPSWRERCRLFVRDVAGPSAQLRIRVMDSDALKEDDTLGIAVLPLAQCCDGATHAATLDVQAGGAGPGGGSVRVSVRFRAFAPPQRSDTGGASPAPLPRALMAALPARAARAAGALAAAAGAIAAAAASVAADAARKRAEAALWAVPADDSWALLAAAPASAASAALPADFEKVCFVSHGRTDTQVALWRAPSRRTLVVAFRGTETAKLQDIITDAKLAPRGFNAERVSSSGGDGAAGGAAVHEGFLQAFDSVRPRVLAALDDARGAGPRAKALAAASGAAATPQPPWHVFVTGHSLGGALATLFAAELAASLAAGTRSGITLSMVNYGSPRVGNAAFVAQYNALVPDSVRIVNGSDAIPTVPALLGYRHVAHGVRISAAGAAAREEPPPALRADNALAQLAAAALGGAGGVDAQAAAEAALALASLVDAAALEAHFEDQYLVALRAALQLETTAATRGE